MPLSFRSLPVLAASLIAAACGSSDGLIDVGNLCQGSPSADGCQVPAPRDPGNPGDSCTDDADCRQGTICFEGSTCVGSGTLRVTLTFDTDSDFDLHLITPARSEIYYAHKEAEGGTLDVDQCVGSCTAGASHVENIVFPGVAPKGPYEVWVVNYDGRNPGSFRVEIETGSTVQTHTGALPAMVSAFSERFTFTME